MSKRDKRRKRAKRKARHEQGAQAPPGTADEIGMSTADTELVVAPTPTNHKEATDEPAAESEASRVEALSGVDLASPPRLDQLDTLSTTSKPTAAGAWWIAAQTGQHVVELGTLRDRRSGEPLPRPLRDVLRSVAEAVASGMRPRPADEVHRASVLSHDAIRNIVASPRSRLERHHEQRPVYALREMDARCMMWMAKQPGRTVREKLGGRQHALAVVRRFSLDTQENRLLRRLIDILMRRLDARLSANEAFDEHGPCDDLQWAALTQCRRALGSTELARVKPSEVPRPNNALLGDPDYSRIWRAWLILREAEESLPNRWSSVPTLLTTALFWAVASLVGTAHGSRVAERTVTLGGGLDGQSDDRVVDVLFAPASPPSTDAVGWVEFVARGPFAKGQVKMINRESGRPYGFVASTVGEDFYFGPHTLRDGTDFGSIHEGAAVLFRLARPVRNGQESPPIDAVFLVDDRSLRSLDEGAGGWLVVALTNGSRVVVSAEDLGDRRDRPPLDVGDKVLLRNGGEANSGAKLLHCPPACARLVRVRQSGHRLGVTTCELGPSLDSQTTHLGRVKFVKDRGDKLFGFLRGEDEQDYYFDPDSAGDVFHRLRPGTWVTFRLVSTWGGREAATDLIVVSEPSGLAASEVRELSLGEWTIQFPRGRPVLASRGTPISLISEHDGRVVVAGWGDLDGVRQVRQAILRDAGIPHSKRQPDEDHLGPLRGLGIDASGWRVHFAGPVAQVAGVLPYVNLWHNDGTAPEMGVVGRLDRSPGIDANHSTCSLCPVFEGADDPLSATAARRVFRSLAEELGGHVETSAYVVPDDLDEFSQQSLRAAVAAGFPNSLPVVRSVAAALAWQEKEFEGATVDDGDAIIVVSSDLSRLTATVLVARTDGGLRKTLPETGGIYWERRPALAVEEYSEGLGGRALWFDYAQRLVNAPHGDLGRTIDLGLVANYLVDSGIVQEVAWTGFPQWLRIGERWFVVEHDHRLWSHIVQQWCPRFERAFEAGLGASLSSGVPRARRAHLLLVGRPFDEPTVRSLVETRLNAHVRRAGFASTVFLSDEAGDLAAGAAAFSRRVSADLPVWRDWLPDLFLEVVRDGLFDEIELMKDVVVDAALGTVHRVEVPETLVLPGGAADYRFSLVAGRANRRPMPVDFHLESAAFPLQQDARVRLRLTYRYGVDNGYGLSVVPTDPGAPFSEVQGSWVASGHVFTGEHGPAPALLTASLDPSDWEQRQDDVTDSLRRAARHQARLLSGDDADPDRTGFALSRQLRWLRFQLLDLASVGDPRAFVEAATGTDFTQMLTDLAGGADPAGLDDRTTHRLREEALVFLCAVDASESSWAAETVRRTVEDYDQLLTARRWLPDAIATLHRRSPDGGWMDELWERVLTAIAPYENPQMYGAAVRAIGRAVWRVDGFLLGFTERHGDFVPRAVHIVENSVRSTLRRAAQAVDSKSDVEIFGGHVQGFQASCELMLGLLALRGTTSGEMLAVGSPRMLRIAKAIRRADSLIAKAGKEVRSALELQVPLAEKKGLERVSDLAFVVNSYLTGAAGLTMIRIESFADDE